MTKRKRQTISTYERNRCTVEGELEDNTRNTPFNGAPVLPENHRSDDEILHTIFSSLFTGIWFRLLGKIINNENIYENLGISDTYLILFLIKTKIFKV